MSTKKVDMTGWHPRKVQRHSLKPEVRKSPEVCAEIVRLLRKGCTTREICNLPDMPDRSNLFEWLQHDPIFKAEYDEAKIACAQAVVDEALEYSREEIEPDKVDGLPGKGDHARAKIAQSYADVALRYAEKIAPRQFGQLLKLGSEDGTPLAVQVVSFAQQTHINAHAKATRDDQPEGDGSGGTGGV